MDPVFGIYNDAHRSEGHVVILKSKAIEKLIKDGLTPEEAEEMWSYNIEGSKGSFQYSTVDDTVDDHILEDMISHNDIVDPSSVDYRKEEISEIRKEIEKDLLEESIKILNMDIEELPLYIEDKADIVKHLARARLNGEVRCTS